MVIADRIIYLQLQKTGCTYVARLLADCIGGVQVGKHNRLSNRPTGKHIIGSVRNPWDWYVSLWAFGCEGKGGVYERLTGQSRSSDLWRSVYGDSSDAEAFRAWLRMMFDSRLSADLGEGYGDSSLRRFAGFLMYRYMRLHSRHLSGVADQYGIEKYDELIEFDVENNVLDSVIRKELLEDDLVRALVVAGYELTHEQRQAISCAKQSKQNTSRHRPFEFYYDRATIELVAERERFIIGKYGYGAPAGVQCGASGSLSAPGTNAP